MPTADSPDQRMPLTSRREFISQLSWLGGCAVLGSAAAGFAAGQISAAEVDLSTSDHWNQWRGPQRTGFATRSSTPDSLDESHLQTLWNVPLEPSYSGPLISGNAIYTTATVGKKTEHVYRLDRTTGKKIWEQSWEGAISVPFFAKANGDWIRGTPALAGSRLYVPGIRDLLVCLNAETGEILWKLDFVSKFNSALPTFGFVASPLVTEKMVFVQAGGAVCALDPEKGDLLWRSFEDGGGMNGSAFSSPFLAEIDGQTQLLIQSREKLAGLVPQTGEVLWQIPIPAFRGMNITTPVVWNGCIFTSSYGGGSFLMKPEQTSPGQWTVNEVWKNKVQGYMSTPIVSGDHAYLHLRNQRFACIDLKTGKEAWITQPFGKYWSLVAIGNRLLTLDETGELRLILMTPEKFEQISSRSLKDNSWAHLAVAGQEIAIRDLNGLTLYKWT